MRISGGRARGITLRVPRGATFRPATDRLRQGVFSSLGARIAGARFGDFFAGTGSYGLEALSRGAGGGVFVENHRAAVEVLRTNLAAVARSAGFPPHVASIHNRDALQWRPPAGEWLDLIFCDPPFREIAAQAPALFRHFAGFLRREPAGILVFEMPGEVVLQPAGWRLLRRIGEGRGQPTCCLFALAEAAAVSSGRAAPSPA